MEFLPKKLVREWSWRVDNGMPDYRNPLHLIELKNLLIERKFPHQFVDLLLNNLTEQKFYARNPRGKQISVFHNRDNYEKAVKGGYEPIDPAEAERELGKQSEEPTQEPTEEPPQQDNKIKMDIDNHGGLDKKKEKQDLTKSDVDTKREKIGGKTFSESIETTDKDFMQKNLENKTTNTFKMPDSVINNSKIPKKYIQFIERTLNTQKNTKDGTNYSDYFGLGKVGAGQTESNIGELLSMMATTMKRDDRDEFFRTIGDHLQRTKYNGEKIHVSPAWVKAAKENSSAVLRMMYDKYGRDYEIVASAWDVKGEFTALGFDYGEKGDSTDIVFKVKVGDTDIKEEISLKQKLKNQRLWNGTIGSAFGEGILPQHLQQKGVNQYSQNQIKNVENFYLNNQTNINEFLGSVSDNDDYNDTLAKIAKAMDNKENNQELIRNQFNNFLSQYRKDLAENPDLVLSREYIKENLKNATGKSPNKRAIDKVSVTLGRMMEDYGDEMAGEFVNKQKEHAKEHAREVAVFINTSNEAKENVLKKVQEKLPLKSVSDGSESIILGEYVINKKTMKGIFGTDDWSEVVENLQVNPDADPPMIEYQGKVRGKDVVVPITTIGIREDGEGYGGAHKFEMTVAQDFSNYVESVSRDLFGDQEPIRFPDSAAALRGQG